MSNKGLVVEIATFHNVFYNFCFLNFIYFCLPASFTFNFDSSQMTLQQTLQLYTKLSENIWLTTKPLLPIAFQFTLELKTLPLHLLYSPHFLLHVLFYPIPEQHVEIYFLNSGVGTIHLDQGQTNITSITHLF